MVANHAAILTLAVCVCGVLPPAAASAQSDGLLCEVSDTLSLTPTTGEPSGIALEQHLAYLADGTAGLLIIDISEPAAPAFVAARDTPGTATALVIENGLVFVADGDGGLQIIDVSNPAMPEIVGSFPTAEPALGLCVASGVAYIAVGLDGMLTIDVSDPANPVLLGSYDTAGTATSVACAQGIAYIADADGGLVILDVSNPSSPTLLGQSGAAQVQDVMVQGDLAFAATGSGMAVFDVREPTAPVLLNHTQEIGGGNDITIADNRAYLSGASLAYDIADPEQPSPVGAFSHAGSGAAVRDNLAYIASTDGLLILDITDPPSSTVLGSVYVGTTPEGLAVRGDYAYVADWDDGVVVVDISNPTAPVRIANVPTGNLAHDLALEGNYVYVADPSAGLAVIDVSEPSSPVMVVDPTQFRGTRIDVDGDMACILSSSRLYMVDISNPLEPTLLAQHSGFGAGRRHGKVQIVDGYAFVAGPGLSVFDLSDPEAPPIAQVETDAAATTVEVVDGLACVGTHLSLTLFDVTEPDQPTELGQLVLPLGGAESSHIIGDILHVGLFNGEVWLVDISDPANPHRLISTDRWLSLGGIWDIQIQDDLAFIIDSFTGLIIMNVSDCDDCPADFDSNDLVDSRDIIAFLNAWAAQRGTDCSGGCSADFTGDGLVDSRDFIAFLNAWNAGC
ncbi:MAG: hypothetical protein HND58_05860 [Planctomycetota bacterium]|nr:MAG: hypothetical protein HND58_05860 [Planctomycetota bacterium]